MIDPLREIASSATPGPWADPEYNDAPGDQGWYVLNGEVGMRQHAVAGTSDVWSSRAENDAKHIATFDPPTVLALLDIAEAAEPFDAEPCRGLLATDCLAENAYPPCAPCRVAAALDRLREVARG